MRRWIMHVDMDAFYASVEQRDHPEWRGQPVVVGSASARGVVATASYEARRFGIHSALSGVIAKRRCPHAIFVRPRLDVYRDVSAQVHEVLYHYAPEIEPLSLDEAFLDISGMGGHYPSLQALGQAVRADIKKATQLTASVGIAPNKFLAKLASDFGKPDGLVVIPYGREEAFLAPLEVRRLWGVGAKTEALLTAAGYRTIGAVAAADPAVLTRLLGAQGPRLQALARGRDDRPVRGTTVRKSIGEENTFAEDLYDVQASLNYLARACDLVAGRLRAKKLRARTVTLKLRFGSYRTVTRSQTVAEPMDLQEELFFHIQSLYNKIVKTEGIRLLGVTASNLVDAQYELRLFPDDKDRLRRATEVADAVREKFGKDALRAGYWWEQSTKGEKTDDGK